MKRTYLYDILAVVVVGVVVYGLAEYFGGAYEDSLSQRLKLQQEVGVKQGLTSVSELENVSDYMDAFLPEGQQRSQLTAEISQLANQVGVEVRQLDFTDTTSGSRRATPAPTNTQSETEVEEDIFEGTYRTSSVALSFAGSEASFQDLLERLVSLDRFVDIQTATYTRSTEEDRITGSIVANVYYR